MQRLRDQALPWVNTEDLEAVEALAKVQSGERIGSLQQGLLAALTTKGALDQARLREGFKAQYDEAVAIAQPATTAYLRHAHAINNLTRSHSLASVDLMTLKLIDAQGHVDTAFGTFVKELIAKLAPKRKLLDVIAYSQFFEVYGEAITLQHLRASPGIKAGRVPASTIPGEARPDFICQLDNGPTFYVEVKSLDIVDGEFRQREMMHEALDLQVELEARRKEGRRVASVIGEIAPYRGLGDETYDPRSLKRVVDTLREKCSKAFKPSQFEQGPTFALAIIDRLLLPRGRNDLAAYYYEPEPARCCVTGVLWHAAYGSAGTPVFRAPDFEGKPTLEGHLDVAGLYVNPGQPFPGEGLIVLDTHCGRRVSYGLASPAPTAEPWSPDLTEDVLRAICDAHNDRENTLAYKFASVGKD